MNGKSKSRDEVSEQAIKAGELIRSLRKERGLTQAQFAERLGVTIPTVRRLESGDTSISLNTLLSGLAELNIVDEVLCFTNNRPRKPLPQIEPGNRSTFSKRLQLQGINSRDAENAAWILSLNDQQRIALLQKQEQEQRLCGIALR